MRRKPWRVLLLSAALASLLLVPGARWARSDHGTAAGVGEVNGAVPRATGKPTRVVSFNGPDGATPDAADWNHEVGGNGWGADQLQTYTASSANSHLDGSGNLVITATREDVTGPDGITRPFTSARLTTQGKVVVAPGSYVEAPIAAPVGAGVWPAFWLLGADITDVGWPASGELDVLEVLGGEPTVAHSATHQATRSDPDTDYPYDWDEPGGSIDLRHSLDSRTHLYGVYFDGATVRFYIDRHEHIALRAADAAASGRTWPFGNPQYLLLNIAIGGAGGDPSATVFPKSMTVGAISIWQHGLPFAARP
jgi:beta-glucanase (GH16 family)